MKRLQLPDNTQWWVDVADDDTDTVEWAMRNGVDWSNGIDWVAELWIRHRLQAASLMAQFRVLTSDVYTDEQAVEKLLAVRKALRESKS